MTIACEDDCRARLLLSSELSPMQPEKHQENTTSRYFAVENSYHSLPVGPKNPKEKTAVKQRVYQKKMPFYHRTP